MVLLASHPSVGQSQTYENQEVDLRDQTVDGDLVIKDAPKVTLQNVTITGEYRLEDSSDVSHEGVSVSGRFRIESTLNATLRNDSYGANVEVWSSSGIEFNQTSFGGDFCSSNSSVSFVNSSPPNSGTDQCQGSSTPTSPSSGAPASPSSYSPPTYTPYSPTYSPYSPTYSPYSPSYTYTPAPPPTYPFSSQRPAFSEPSDNERYEFELENKALSQDVWVSGAQRVRIVDATVEGDLFVGWSANVVLERVKVSGVVMLDNVQRVDIKSLEVGGDLALSFAEDFSIKDASVQGFVGCFQCHDGVFDSVSAGRDVVIADSTNVRQVDVESSAAYQFSGPRRVGEAMGVRMNVSSNEFHFSYERSVSVSVSVDVRIEYSARDGTARLQLPSPDGDRNLVEVQGRFEKIREFEDRDGNGAYDLGDRVIREYLIEDLPILNLRQERLETDADGWMGRIDYQLPQGGVFSLIFTTKDGSPDDTKIDVEFRDFPYATARSQLALQIRLAAATDWVIEEGDTEDRLVFAGAGGVNGYFSWVRHAEADGRESPVVARVLEEHKTAAGERDVVLYLGYERADHIFHDPSLGIFDGNFVEELSDVEVGNLVVYGTTLAAVLVFLWALGQGTRRDS